MIFDNIINNFDIIIIIDIIITNIKIIYVTTLYRNSFFNTVL